MKNLKLLLIPILLCLGIINSYAQDVAIPFSWVNATPSNNSSIGVFQCEGVNISLNTGSPHQLSGASAFIPGGGPLAVPMTISFSKPICNLGVLIRDLDENPGSPAEWIQFTGSPIPSGIDLSFGGPPFSYAGGIADPDGAANTEAWVNWNDILTSVSFTYNRNPASMHLWLDSLRFDCDCSIPTDLSCCYGNSWQTLSWEDVPGAIGYEIEFGFNDMSSGCCDSVTELPTGWMEFVTDNVFLVPETFADCFWWRVRSVFSDGSKSDWSEKMCDCVEKEDVLCTSPINLDCQIATSAGTKTISWDPVAGALGYEVSMTHNDPACCPVGSGTVSTTLISTTNTFISSIGPNECFSWKVRTICTDAPIYSEWSDSKCSSDCYFPTTIAPSPGRVELIDGSEVNSSTINMTLTPNPANEFVTITAVSNNNETIYKHIVINIIDITGTEVYRDNMSINTPKRVQLKNLKPGIYLCRIIDGNAILNSSRLIIK